MSYDLVSDPMRGLIVDFFSEIREGFVHVLSADCEESEWLLQAVLR